jgi:hypothetical protein
MPVMTKVVRAPGGAVGWGGSSSGRFCRVGQYLYIKVHDGGTPATRGDGIKWKWFTESAWQSLTGSQVDPLLPPSEKPICSEPKLCKKTILAGNLVVHLAP